jgi:AcrR family transcriptional regulator
MKSTDASLTRREPRQQRSRQTVDAMLDAVERVLKRHGIDAITTNRIAEAAGVSIGSVYQYFPDKRAIFTALHGRHVTEVSQAIERALAGSASSTFEDFTRSLVEMLVDVHARDPELHEIISAAVPESALGFRNALQETFERVISSGQCGRYDEQAANRMRFVLPRLIEALVHGAAQPRLPISIQHAKQEAVRAVLLYLSACRTAPL